MLRLKSVFWSKSICSCSSSWSDVPFFQHSYSYSSHASRCRRLETYMRWKFIHWRWLSKVLSSSRSFYLSFSRLYTFLGGLLNPLEMIQGNAGSHRCRLKIHLLMSVVQSFVLFPSFLSFFFPTLYSNFYWPFLTKWPFFGVYAGKNWNCCLIFWRRRFPKGELTSHVCSSSTHAVQYDNPIVKK